MPVERVDRTDARLGRVLLTFPTTLAVPAAASADMPQRTSWIQLARTGNFTSARYGKFSITTDDLKTMLVNFTTITPKAPTKLPVDYDHLSMDPKQPGDGIAAGWMSDLELRQSGTELWARVEWTPEAAKRIEAKEYCFVSPSFVRDYTHKDGRKIGTTLRAAAITNHPFLEGMAALTLYSFSAMGDLALAQPDDAIVELADLGQLVTFVDDAEKTPELTANERRRTFTIKATIGDGEDQFVRLTTPEDGQEFGWFRVTQLAPARAANADPMPKDESKQREPAQQEVTMHATDTDQELITLANTIARDKGVSLRHATIEAGMRRPDLAQGRRKSIGVEDAPDSQKPPAVVHNLSRKADEGFAELCLRTALERQIDLRSAVRMVSESFPQLAESYANGEF